MVDKKIHFGYQETASFYNNLDEAKNLYLKYGVDENNITLIEAENKNLEILPKMDIIVSFIAWGFHFPLEIYLQNVINLMHENTILIIDIRDDTISTESILKNFKIINEEKHLKSCRYIFKRQEK